MAKKNKYLDFISDDHFLKCVKHVCDGYSNLPVNITPSELQRNTIDPFKMVFDIANQNIDIEEWIRNEKVRQADKTLNNRIGEFHQMLLGGVKDWINLGIGDETKVDLKKTDNSIFIELKNKFNTVNSDSLDKVRDKLEKNLGKYPKSIGYWAYILDKNGKSIDEVWTRNGKSDPRLRRISGVRVYELVTKDPKALFKVWTALPVAIEDTLRKENLIGKDDSRKLIEFFQSAYKN